MRILFLMLLLVASVASSARAQAAPALPAQQVVERYLGAYNRHDVEGMMELVHPQFRWLGVAGDTVATETAGVESLRKSVASYLASLPSARSSIEAVMAAGAFVSVWERAHWTDRAGRPRSQSSLSVYEVEQGRIRRVWYYPVQP